MEEKSIVPDREAMHLLIKSYANNGDLKGVQDTLKVFYLKALKPTTAIMNSVLESIVKSPQVDDWDAFMQSYSSLFPANKLQPDNNTYSLLLQACLKDKRVKDAVLIVDEIIELDIKISREARETFRLVVGDEIYEEVADKLKSTYTHKAVDKVRTATTIDKTLNFKKMWGVEPRKETAYSHLRKNPNKDLILASKRHVGDYNTIIRDYAKDGDVASVKNIMDEMISKKYLCDVEMMNTLVIAHSKNNDSLGAQEVVNDMKRRGMRLTLSTYRILISAYAAVGDPDGALRVLQSAVAAGFRPGEVSVLNSLANTLITITFIYLSNKCLSQIALIVSYTSTVITG